MINIETNTRLLESSYKGAPQILNTYGSFLNVLVKTLVEGFNENTSISFEEEDSLIKINLPRNHGYIYNQVISISGSSLESLNTVHRVIETRHGYVKISSPLTESLIEPLIEGAIIKTAPLGYSIAYSNILDEGTVCFKNTSIKSPAILKVIDKLPPNGYDSGWSKFARVVVGQEVDEFGDFLSNDKVPYNHLYPEVEKTGNGVAGPSGIHGYATWGYAEGTDYYNRQVYGPHNDFPKNWKIIGDSNTFYIMFDPSQRDRPLLHGFGNFVSENEDETTNICLQARDHFLSAEAYYEGVYERSETRFGSASNNRGSFLYSTIYGQTKTTCRYTSFGLFVGENSYESPWHSDSIKSMNPSSGRIVSGLMYIKDSDNYVRGYHRGIRYIYGNNSNLTSGSVSSVGSIVLAVVDPNRDRFVSYLFSLKNWEEV